MGYLQNGWFILENTIEMDVLGVPLFEDTSNQTALHPTFYALNMFAATMKFARSGPALSFHMLKAPCKDSVFETFQTNCANTSKERMTFAVV